MKSIIIIIDGVCEVVFYMLKKIFPIFALIAIVGSFLYAKKDSMDDRIVEYNTEKKEFVIVVVTEDNLSNKTAKEYALKRAAEIAHRQGYQYFVITSEDEVYFMRGKKDFPSAYDFPQNLYEEEIVERGFNRERFIQKDREDNQKRPAIRYKVQCVEKKSSSAYSVCDYIDCSQN